jgi:hypothetical protein
VQRRLRFALIALPVVLLALHPIDSADVWFHLATGQWIASHGAVPRQDVFGAASQPWIVHDWLAALLFYTLHWLAGPPALVLFTTCITTLALLLPRWRSSRRGAIWPYEVALLLAAGIAYERFFVRPEVFSLLGAALWTHVLASGGPRRGRDVLLLGLAQVAWTNLHGAFLLGPVLAALAVAGDAFDRLRRSGANAPRWSWPRLALPLVSLAACLITPYGPGLLAHVVQAARDLSGGALRAGVVEWQPTFSQPVAGDLVLMLFLASLVWVGVAAVAGRRGWRGFDLLAVLALTVLACTARRQLAVYAVTVPALAARWLAAERNARWAVPGATRLSHVSLGRAARARAAAIRLAPVASLVPGCVAVWWSAALARSDFYDWAGPPRAVGWSIAAGTHPIGAGEFVAQHALPGPLFNNISAGSYLLWRMHGDPAVLVDGRLLDPAQFRIYRRCLESSREFDAWAATHGPHLVVLALQPFPPVQLFRHLAAAPAWRLAYFDAEGAVFVTEDVAAARSLAPLRLDAALAPTGAPVGAAGSWWRRCDPGEAALRGRMLLQLGFPAAAADLTRALLHCPERWDVGLDLASVWIAAGRTAEARPLIERALREDGANPEAWLCLGACRAAAGDAPGARTAWEHAAALRPADPRPARLLRTLSH